MRFDPNTGTMALGVVALGPCHEPITIATLALTALSTGVSAMGTIAAGNQAKAEAEFTAKQMEQKANESRAVGQRRMFQQQKEGELAQSRLRAVGAATSGDTTDTGILNLGGDIEKKTEWQALNEFAAGENAGRGYEDQAMAARMKGEAAKSTSRYKAFGTILDGASSMAFKYGGGKTSYGLGGTP